MLGSRGGGGTRQLYRGRRGPTLPPTDADYFATVLTLRNECMMAIHGPDWEVHLAPRPLQKPAAKAAVAGGGRPIAASPAAPNPSGAGSAPMASARRVASGEGSSPMQKNMMPGSLALAVRFRSEVPPDELSNPGGYVAARAG